jgi:predicted ribosomally synthesized peptide with SipW-like signal peptide
VRRPLSGHGSGTLTRVRAALAGALVIGVASVGTLASWSDREHAESGFASGTFTLVSRTDTGAFAAHPVAGAAELRWPLAPLFPGQSAAAWVQVQSSGSVPGSVLLSGVALADDPEDASPEAALRDALVVRVAASASEDPAPPECTTSTPGTEVTGLTQIPAIPAQDLEPAGASTVTFCIVVTLPDDAPTIIQGAEIVPTWIFTGST